MLVGPHSAEESRIVPYGTRIRARLDDTLDARTTRVGDRFGATVVSGIAAGTRLWGHVSAVDIDRGPDDAASIGLAFDRIQVGPELHRLDANVVRVELQPRKARDRRAEISRFGTVLPPRRPADLPIEGTLISLGLGRLGPVLPAGSLLTLRTTRAIDLDAPTSSVTLPKE